MCAVGDARVFQVVTCYAAVVQVLSNTVKQKRKEKAGKWSVPIPKVNPVTDDEMFKVIRSGKRKGEWPLLPCSQCVARRKSMVLTAGGCVQLSRGSAWSRRLLTSVRASRVSPRSTSASSAQWRCGSRRPMSHTQSCKPPST